MHTTLMRSALRFRGFALASAVLIIALAAGAPRPVLAVDAATTRQYCEDIRRAAEEASVRYVRDRQPLRDPAETFDNATRSCLGSIMRFKNPVRFLSLDFSALIQGFVDTMVSQFLNRACSAVRGEFDRSVVDAERFLRERSRNRVGVGTFTSTAPSALPQAPGVMVRGNPGE